MKPCSNSWQTGLGFVLLEMGRCGRYEEHQDEEPGKSRRSHRDRRSRTGRMFWSQGGPFQACPQSPAVLGDQVCEAWDSEER